MTKDFEAMKAEKLAIRPGANIPRICSWTSLVIEYFRPEILDCKI